MIEFEPGETECYHDTILRQIPQIIKVLEHDEEDVRWGVLKCIEKLIEYGGYMLSFGVTIATDSWMTDSVGKEHYRKALLPFVPRVFEMLRDEDEGVREQVVNLISRLAPDSELFSSRIRSPMV